LKHTKRDAEYTEDKSKHKEIVYPKHDGKITFDILTNLTRSGTNHDHDQPSHLRIKSGQENTPSQLSWKKFGAPE
jgi:electron-transferring-flavoprotein dehydrogenase